jgi:predicted outer membrane repeat protein
MGYPGKLITFISLLLTLSLAASAHAAQFIVTRSDDPTPGPCAIDDCSLREAVIASNGNDQNDTIVLEATTYSLTRQGADENEAFTGDLDLADHGNVLVFSGVSVGTTVIDATALNDRIFDVNIAEQDISFTQLTLRNGDAGAADGGAFRMGGGNGTLLFSDTRLQGNHALRGGAVWACCNSFEGLIAERTVFFDNSADVSGGAINTSSGFIATIVDSTIDMNDAGIFGGGVFGSQSDFFNLDNSTVSNNTAGSSGGGLQLESLDSASLNNSTVSGNEAVTGGGISTQFVENLRLRNVTITENEASGSGGGFYGERDVESSTIANSILSGNTSSSSAPGADCFLNNSSNIDFTSLGFNIFGDISNCTLSGPDDLLGIDDPGLGPLTNNGGPTPTHGNLEGSPAIDAGDPSGCLDSNGVEFTTDQRGEPRPLNGRCDIGAFESIFVPPSPVPTESPGGGGAETESGGCAMGGSGGVHMTGFWALLVLLSLGWGARRGMR